MKGKLEIWFAALRRRKLDLIIDQMLASGGNFTTTLLCARVLDEYSFGIFSIGFLITLFGGSLIAGGLIFPMATIYPVAQDGTKHVAGTVAGFAIAGVCVTGVAAIFGVALSESLILSVACMAVGVNFQELVRKALILERDTELLLASEFLTYAPRIAILALMIFSHAELSSVIWLITLTALLGGSVYFIRYRVKNRMAIHTSWRANLPQAKWLIPAGIMQWLSVYVFLLVGSVTLSPTQIGNIRLVQNLANVLGPIQGLAESVVGVRAAQIKITSGVGKLSEYLTSVALRGLFVFGPVCLLSILFGDWLLTAIYGRGFSMGAVVLMIFVFVQAILFTFIPVRAGLRAINAPRLWAGAYAIGTIAAVVVLTYSPPTSELSVALGILGSAIIVGSAGTGFYIAKSRTCKK